LAEITYEVYVLTGGRWTIESRYTNLEREVAIEDAKSMHSNPSVKAVKVIKETYDAEKNSTIEATVFTTESISDIGGGGGGGFANMEVEVGGGPDFAEMTFDTDTGGFDDYDEPVARKPRKAKKKARASGKSPIGTIFLKIMMITAVSLGFAFFMTYLSTEGFF
jgi:hypothetical protein